MSTARRRTLVRATAVTACAGSLLALPTAAALAEGVPAAASAHSSAAQRTLVKSLELADGVSTAKVYRMAEGGYQADILAVDGARAATLTSRDGVIAVDGSGGLHAALDPAGRLTSWVGGAIVQGGGHAVAGGGHKTGTRDGQIVPVSAEQRAAAGDTRALEAASAEGRRLSTLADGPGEGVLLLAAGGGIAAVGAAGLGFAMLRRGRTDG
ncbi:hypothetical protein AW27_010165 [Streptomyces sp. PCS3-D2]|uniref:hypothetical protein n=1 Tax=Streptomyces sp. PCS3-D2 TaxID=1460244 RepID=UPI000450BF1F|nr:hypothetical protein [Streptomyces sp. PCS3-D2]WKV71852.1 hypothetical protein AW27_010165 [Streptomyces sp. PCS3-D2]